MESLNIGPKSMHIIEKSSIFEARVRKIYDLLGVWKLAKMQNFSTYPKLWLQCQKKHWVENIKYMYYDVHAICPKMLQNFSENL